MTDQRHYERERERRIAIILGGQGRTPASVRQDGAAVAWTLALIVLVAILLSVRACAGGAP